VKGIVASDPFQMRKVPEAQAPESSTAALK
jgi:hypothetical protein